MSSSVLQRTESTLADEAGSRVAVIIASLGRAAEVGDLLGALHRQTLPAALVVLTVTGPADLPAGLPEGAIVVTGSKGLPAQRNRGLDALAGQTCDVVVFFDDDFIPARDWLEKVVQAFRDNPDAAGVTGRVLADGIKGPGLSFEDANDLVKRHEQTDPGPPAPADIMGLYGCNMAFRASAIGTTRFDEKLPLYAWQEDTDFSRRLLPQGRLIKVADAAGVHRGVKGARTPGVKLGWSQIVNPVYLVRKGTVPFPVAAKLMVKNLIANHCMMLTPEPWVDRRGRVKGNWAGIFYLLRGNIDPQEMLKQP